VHAQLQDIHPGTIIVGTVLFALCSLFAIVYINHRHTYGSLGRRKKVGAKRARKERQKLGLQVAGDS